MDIKNYGYYPSTIADWENAIPARITAVHREIYEFVCNIGTGIARLKPGEYYAGEAIFPTTGDFVLLEWQQNGEGRILKTLPRKSCFSRLDPSSSGHKEQMIAANFDYVFILQSLDQRFRPHGLERYLTLAWQSGGIPVILLTKADSTNDCSVQLHEVQKLAIGVEVFAVSAKTGNGINQLRDYLKPEKTIVFIGPSGAGKSTLVNALAGKNIMVTGTIREKDGCGRHTTSHRQLVLLDNGVMVIDTPGMRELGMWDVSSGLGKKFADIEQYFGSCKFRNCRHQEEPGCAIKDAIKTGELLLEHWESYLRLHAEARFVEDKEEYLRKKEQGAKDIARNYKQSQRIDYRHQACNESFICKVCGTPISPSGAGSKHRNHCPQCLSSIHIDSKSGDRASACKGIMEPIGVWIKKNGEWAIIHRCQSCGTLRNNRIAADDNCELLMSIAMRPLENPLLPVV